MDTHYDSCPVCHEAVMVYAIGNCDHPICYRCSTRMRTLCEQSYCPICRTDLSQVYMIHEIKKFSEIPRTGYIQNRKYKIFFEDNTIKEKFEKLLEHRCTKCKNKERTLKALQHHLSKQHTLFYCDLCLEHLKIFTSERKVYSRTELATHRRQGDKDDKSYKEHPLCQFCDVRYFDNDDLFRHLRKDHYFCHFCDTEGSQDYYNDYADLRDHFKVKHYLCEEGECAQAQFTNAFKSNIDYKAHMANEHARNMSKQQAKQARTIDVNINLAPRERRRDRGVIGGNDYQEVNQRQTRPHSSRGPHPRAKDRFREDDMERAIQASLSVMKEEDMKRSEKSKKERSSPEPVIEHTEQEFPTLGNVSGGVAKTTGKESPVDSEHRDSDSEKSSESLAKLLAKKTSQSVQHGNMGLNDFPSLHDDTIRPVGADLLHKLIVPNSAPQQRNNMGKNEKVPKQQHPPQLYDKKLKYGPLADEFPGLPSTKPVSSSNLTWVNKIPAKPAPSIKVVVNNSSSAGNNKKVKSEHVSRKTFDSENDFPTLGCSGASVGSTGWLKQVNEPKPQKTKPKTIDWFEGHDSDEFNIDNLKGDKDSKQLIEDTHSKNKRKKKKKSKTNNEDTLKLGTHDQCRINENSTLDNIAFSLLSDVPKNTENVIADDTAVNLDENPVTMETEQCLVPAVQENTSVDIKKEEVKIIEEVKIVGGSKKEEFPSLNVSDFPSLSSSSGKSSKPPPPGFGASKSTNRVPPGFDEKSSETSTSLGARPPPGFTSLQSSDDFISSAKSSLSLKNILPVTADLPLTTDMGNFKFAEPREFQARNKALISQIKDSIDFDREKFDRFKTWSGEFRKGSIGATEYYEKCEKLVGEEKFVPIFSELLVLLPDIDKQQELLRAYNQLHSVSTPKDFVLHIGSKSKEAPWSKQVLFQSCPTCRQVLLNSDFPTHLATHSQENDFPLLESYPTKAQGPGMRAWLKAS